jgi:hypothetical protein
LVIRISAENSAPSPGPFTFIVQNYWHLQEVQVCFQAIYNTIRVAEMQQDQEYLSKFPTLNALNTANFKGTHTAIETRMNNITKCGTGIENPECEEHSYS